ncbi:DNA polymerase III subunit gamma/tau [Comamonas sp. NLF-1-9]|uniref:DNA polymerase III subunit gamma/tau n=1 Tax=Comamonas sp. NLF-1-9 TaxID=2853163 RepID=UPI001C4407E8|nr:DNA polymerase III subunit gamma/tau [Comamonas sp. NLF-1-9]QXL85074.1 DNA polymerase III subunit gamma/tau [Comamonas sp. NLF-1-9]
MSYLVLARKYRPRNFSQMVGQEHVVKALANALTQQRLHHAYLFTGTRGIGKTTVSRILAKSLNCVGANGQGGITATPCDVCPACTAIDAGRFADYVELDAASNRGVDEVQGLLEQAVYKPVQGRFKVFMIDEVHMLTNTAFNAMLKTLEEPPEYLKFVLATTDPQKVPVTVLSRCLQFNLRPMAPEVIAQHLAQVLGTESIAAEGQALRLIAHAARGSMRDALSLTDQAIAFGGGALQEEAVRQMLGSADRAHVFALIDALAQGDGQRVVQTSEALRVQGLSAAATLQDMVAVLQGVATAQVAPDAALLASESGPDAAEMLRLAQAMPADEVQLLYSICLHGMQELGLAPDEYAALTMVLLRLLAFKPAGPGAEKKKLKPAEAAKARPPAAPSPQPAQAPAADSAPGARPALQQTPALASSPSSAPIPTPTPTPTPVPASARAVPTAHDSAASDVAQSAVPGDLRLPVRTPESLKEKPSQTLVPTAQAATQTMSVPVRDLPQGEDTTAMATELAPTPEGDVWHALVQQLVAQQKIGALVRELALQSQLVARDADHWHLRVENASLNQATTRERLRLALQEAGQASQISVEVGAVSDSPARRNAAAEVARQRRAEAIVHGDPQVQRLMREFGARIVPGSIRLA